MKDSWVVLTVRKSTRERMQTECWNLFIAENPHYEKFIDKIKTHDFILNRLADYWLDERTLNKSDRGYK